MKKIVFIGHRDLYFGAESVMFRIISFLQNNQLAEPLVILPKSNHDGFRQQLHKEGITEAGLFSYKLIGGSLFRCVLCLAYNTITLFKLIFLFRKRNIDLIYTNTSVNILGAMLAWALNKPHIWHFHEQPTGGDFKWVPKGLFPLYRYLISREGTMIVFISKTQKELWEKEFGIGMINYEIIYTPPVFLPEPLVSPAKEILSFGYLGSWTESKNLLSLINSYSRLKDKYPSLPSRLVMMGGGESEATIKRAISQLKLDDQIVFMEHSSNVLPFFAAIDVLVLPSYFESWGLVVLEALSQQKATIVTSNTGLKEILKQNEDCIFVNPLDKDQLFTAMEKLLLNPAYREQLAINSYHTLKKLELSGHFEDSIRSLFK